jgi:hypothetical protein
VETDSADTAEQAAAKEKKEANVIDWNLIYLSWKCCFFLGFWPC